MTVYEGIRQGLREALEYAQGKRQLRTERVSKREAVEHLPGLFPEEGTAADLDCEKEDRIQKEEA